MGLRELVVKNRSYRRFREDAPVPVETLLDLVDLARLTPSARNMQPLRYAVCAERAMNERIFGTLSWAGYLKDGAPRPGQRPAAYVVLLGDTTLAQAVAVDHGIAAQTMLLGAVERGLGGCMVASVDRDRLRSILALPQRYALLLVVALGVPDEDVVLERLGPAGSIEYWRDEAGRHHVPKRALEDLVVGRWPPAGGAR